eukprot:gb/GFBE01040053.1/.p1 GENE.gb/GFBE01040053.1/~~gb/GFBE01040053.1/.p1  ORF type:complete len:229 (+),score=29.94 gb/GFBE01040053.1/:1-687(+)
MRLFPSFASSEAVPGKGNRSMRSPGINRPYYRVAYVGCPSRRGEQTFVTKCCVCLRRAGKTRRQCLRQREEQNLRARPGAPLPAAVVDAAEEGEAWLRARRRKLKPVRSLEQVEAFGFFSGCGKHPKGPGAKPKKAKREDAVTDALQHAHLHRQRQRAVALAPASCAAPASGVGPARTSPAVEMAQCHVANDTRQEKRVRAALRRHFAAELSVQRNTARDAKRAVREA